MRRRDLRLAGRTFTDAVGARFGEQQRLHAGDLLETRQVVAQFRFPMQVDVEGADVVTIDVEIFGRRKVHIGQQAVRGRRLDIGVQISQETLDPRAPMPPDHGRRNLVAE